MGINIYLDIAIISLAVINGLLLSFVSALMYADGEDIIKSLAYGTGGAFLISIGVSAAARLML